VRQRLGSHAAIAGGGLEVGEDDLAARHAPEPLRTEELPGVLEDLTEPVLFVPDDHELGAARHEPLGLVAEPDHHGEQLGLRLGVAPVQAVEHRPEQADVGAVHRQVQLGEQHTQLRDVSIERRAIAGLECEEAAVHRHREQALS
jgi:hypothetical protein